MRLPLLLLLASTPSLAWADWTTVEGTVERVWEDGLSLKVGADSVRIDTWAVCGDATPLHIRVGDRLSIEGDRELVSLDAARITRADGVEPCLGAEPNDEA